MNYDFLVGEPFLVCAKSVPWPGFFRPRQQTKRMNLATEGLRGKMTDRQKLGDQNETPEDVATLYSWAKFHGAKYRDFSASRAQSREKARERAQEDIEAEKRAGPRRGRGGAGLRINGVPRKLRERPKLRWRRWRRRGRRAEAELGAQAAARQLDQAASGNYAAGTQNASFTVTAEAPTISFTVPNQTYGVAPFTVSATSNSSGAITYSVVSGPATISGSTVTITGVGTVVLGKPRRRPAATTRQARRTRASRLLPKRRRSTFNCSRTRRTE